MSIILSAVLQEIIMILAAFIDLKINEQMFKKL